MKQLIVLAGLLVTAIAAPAFGYESEFCRFGPALFDVQSPFIAILGLVLLVLEFFLPTKGILGTLGALFFMFGSSSLINNPCPTWQLSWPMVVLLNILVLGTFAGIGYITIRGYRRHTNNDMNPLVGAHGHVIEWNDNSKRVEVGGAVWQATSHHHTDFTAGQKITVTHQDNLTLRIKPQGE
jgi:membrane-bound ClpP family serine protease